MNKQRFASIIGVGIIVIHVGLILYILNFLPPGDGENNVLQIILPFTATYAIGVVKWVIETQGHITSKVKVGGVYIVIVSIISAALLFSLPYALYLYSTNETFLGPQLSWYVSGVEAGFGVLFALVFNDMFAGGNGDDDGSSSSTGRSGRATAASDRQMSAG